MDYGKGFTFMFEDPDWLRKLAIGTGVGLLGILFIPFIIGLIPLIILIGYSVDVARNVMNGVEQPMPEWQDWGGFLSRGIKVFAAELVWAIPAILLVLPLMIGTVLTNQGQGAEGIGILLVVCGSCLVVIWTLFLTLITPAIFLRIAATDQFSSAFELGNMWAFTRDNLGQIIITLLLVYVVAGLIAAAIGMIGFLALVIGALITIPLAMLWQYLVQAHLFGQIAKNSVTPLVV
jgi:hypothetical protein